MTQSELVEQARALAAERSHDDMDFGTKVDVLEAAMMELLEIQIMKPPVGRVASLATGGLPGVRRFSETGSSLSCTSRYRRIGRCR